MLAETAITVKWY